MNSGYPDLDESLDSSSSSSSSSDTESSESEVNWTYWFTSLRGNELFCLVDQNYILDNFNLTGLNTMVPEYSRALDVIRDVRFPVDSDEMTSDRLQTIHASAHTLYGLIHARFILTSEGIGRMRGKYDQVHFGRCPRVYCEGQPVLPLGLSDIPFRHGVNVFCPRCQELFYPRSSKQASLDGAFFGTTFCHLFLMSQAELIPSKPMESYVPRVFGFRINKDSPYHKLWDKVSTSSARNASSVQKTAEVASPITLESDFSKKTKI